MREEFLGVLDVLKRMVQRKFAGGVKPEEHTTMTTWINGIEDSLFEEERALAELRQKGRDWLEGDWNGREYGMLQSHAAYLVCPLHFDPQLIFCARPLPSILVLL